MAIDAGADEVFSYGGVQPEQVRDLVHGAIFTRGPKDLQRTAFFIGGSDVAAGEKLLAEVTEAHAAAVRPARVGAARRQRRQHHRRRRRPRRRPTPRSEDSDRRWSWAAPVRSASAWPCCWRSRGRRCASPRGNCHAPRLWSRPFAPKVRAAKLSPLAMVTSEELRDGLDERTLVVAAGAAGVVLLPKAARRHVPV